MCVTQQQVGKLTKTTPPPHEMCKYEPICLMTSSENNEKGLKIINAFFCHLAKTKIQKVGSVDAIINLF